MKRKLKNKMLAFLVMIIILFNLNTLVFANTTDSEQNNPSFNLQQVINATKNFTEQGKKGSTTGIDPEKVSTSFAENIRPIGELLIAVGWIISVIITIILGVQFFLSAADPSKQAKVKEGMYAFAIAVVILSAAYPIWSFVIDAISNLYTTVIT